MVPSGVCGRRGFRKMGRAWGGSEAVLGLEAGVGGSHCSHEGV